MDFISIKSPTIGHMHNRNPWPCTHSIRWLSLSEITSQCIHCKCMQWTSEQREMQLSCCNPSIRIHCTAAPQCPRNVVLSLLLCVAIKSIHLLLQFASYLCIKYPSIDIHNGTDNVLRNGRAVDCVCTELVCLTMKLSKLACLDKGWPNIEKVNLGIWQTVD